MQALSVFIYDKLRFSQGQVALNCIYIKILLFYPYLDMGLTGVCRCDVIGIVPIAIRSLVL